MRALLAAPAATTTEPYADPDHYMQEKRFCSQSNDVKEPVRATRHGHRRPRPSGEVQGRQADDVQGPRL